MEDFDRVLVAAQRGDEAAFTTVFRAMQPVLLRYLRVLAGPSSAEDLAAETWTSALRRFDSFRGDESDLRGWLVTIARARWVDGVRAGARRPEIPTDAVPDQRSVDDVEGSIDRAEATARAIALIAQLPPDQAEVVTLRVVADLEVAEVAEIVGKSANHVRVLSHRGLRRLARMVGAEADAAPPADVMPRVEETVDQS